MRTLVAIVLCAACVLLCSCATTKAVAGREHQEHTKEVYRVDSVRDYVHDSVFLYINGDTVYRYQFQYRYRDRFRSDSVYIQDTIYREIPIETKKGITQWQVFQIWCGRILLVLILLYVGLKLLKKYLKPF